MADPSVPPRLPLALPARGTRWLVGSFGLLGVLASLVISACLGSTGNERFRFEARLGGVERDASQPFTFTNTYDWTVTLTEATATVGPLYLNTISPVQPTHSLRSWLIGQAWAHDAFLSQGLVVGEVLGQIQSDLLSPTLTPFPVLGTITGDHVRTAEIDYYPPPGTLPESPDPKVAALVVAGVAVRADQSVPFRGALRLDAVWQKLGTAGSRDVTTITDVREVRGIPTSFVADEGGHLEIRVDMAAMLRNADFAQITDDTQPRDPTNPSVFLLLQDSKKGRDQVINSLYNGLTSSTGTYAVRWVSPSSQGN